MNRKIFSATSLKYIAVIAMTIDHIAFVFVPSESFLYFAMRLIGRLTAPIMSFFITEGFQHTRNRKKYFLRIFIFAIISQPFYFLMIFGRLPQNVWEFFMNLNVMFNFCIGLIMLKFVSGNLHTEKKIIMSAVCFALSDLCDWSYIIPAWILIFFFVKSRNKQILAFISVSAALMILKYRVTAFSYQYGIILSLIPLNLYNGKQNNCNNKQLTKTNRWFFYIYYPLHMAVISAIFLFQKQ